jgi:hypothetical protein
MSKEEEFLNDLQKILADLINKYGDQLSVMSKNAADSLADSQADVQTGAIFQHCTGTVGTFASAGGCAGTIGTFGCRGKKPSTGSGA